MAHEQTIKFSVNTGKWQLWQAGCAIATSRSLVPLQRKFPDAAPVTEQQLEAESEYKKRNHVD